MNTKKDLGRENEQGGLVLPFYLLAPLVLFSLIGFGATCKWGYGLKDQFNDYVQRRADEISERERTHDRYQIFILRERNDRLHLQIDFLKDKVKNLEKEGC